MGKPCFWPARLCWTQVCVLHPLGDLSVLVSCSFSFSPPPFASTSFEWILFPLQLKSLVKEVLSVSFLSSPQLFFFYQIFWKMLTSHSAEGKGEGGYLLVSSCVPGLSWAHDLVGEQLVLPHCTDWQSKVQRG